MHILKSVITDKRLSTNSKVIFVYLWTSFDENGVCSKSRDEFAKALNICKSTFDKNVKQLAFYGYIRIYRTFFGNNTYALPRIVGKPRVPQPEKTDEKSMAKDWRRRSANWREQVRERM